jgi:hypothetical protein
VEGRSVEMFLEDCDNFHDYFEAVFKKYSVGRLTKEEAIVLLKTKYNFDKREVKENYQRMYSGERHLDYQLNEFVEYLKKNYFGEICDPVQFWLTWKQWLNDFFEHCLPKQTNNTNDKEILKKKIEEEMLNIWELLYLNSDKNTTTPDFVRSILNIPSSQNKQQHIEETVQTPEQAQQEKDKIYALLIQKQLIDKIKGKSEYRLTESATIPAIFNTIKTKQQAGLIKITEQDIYKFLKTLKDKNGQTTKDAVNTLKSRNKTQKKSNRL